MSKLTNAEITRLSLLPEQERINRLFDKRIDLEAVVKKARFLEGEALASKNQEQAERYEQLIENAAILEPERKYPEAVIS